MSPCPVIRDIETYLQDNGWQRRPHTWNGASIWSQADGYEVLVPSRDGLADSELRVREILTTLTAVEGRPSGEIVGDINTPFDDIQLYRTFPDGMADGFTSLAAGLRELQCARDMISAAARVVVEGPLPVFPRGTPGAVSDLLQQVRLGPSHPEDNVFTVRVPFNAPSPSPQNMPPQAQNSAAPFGRQVVSQLHAAITAVRSAAARATERDLAPFSETVTAGGSANLCEALSGLAGRQYRQPFEVSFRWGRALWSDIPADAIHFADGTGSVIRAAAAHLRQLSVSGISSVIGYVDSLHGQQANTGYWRIRVRADPTESGGSKIGRTVWVRLSGQLSYDRAMSAHRSQQRVRVRGELSTSNGHTELHVDYKSFEILD